MTIEIEVYCAGCGETLSGEWDVVRSKLRIEPCEECRERAKANALDVGDHDDLEGGEG